MRYAIALVCLLTAAARVQGDSRPVWKLLRGEFALRADHCPALPSRSRSGHAIIRGKNDVKDLRALRELKTLGNRLNASHAALIRLHPRLRNGAVYVRRNPRAVYRDGDLIVRNERAHTFFDEKGRLLCFSIRADIASVGGRTPSIRRLIRVHFGDFVRDGGRPLVRMEYRRGRARYEANRGRVHSRVRLRVLRLAVRNLREIIFAADRAGGKFEEPDL